MSFRLTKRALVLMGVYTLEGCSGAPGPQSTPVKTATGVTAGGAWVLELETSIPSLQGEQRVAVGEDVRAGRLLPEGQLVHVDVSLPAFNPTFRGVLGVTTSEPSGCDGKSNVELRISETGSTHSVAVQSIPVQAGYLWTPVVLDLTPWAGKTVALGLRARSESSDCRAQVALGEPRIVAGSDESSQTPPDIWMIVVDTLRADRTLGEHRQVQTPNFDALSSRGVTFDRCWSTASWTREAVFSLWTGAQPEALARFDPAYQQSLDDQRLLPRDGLSLPRGVPTIPEGLSDSGYRVVGAYTNPTLPPGTGVDRGFDSWWFLGSDPDLIERLPAQVAETDDRRPRMVYAHLLASHMPYDYRPEYTDRHLGLRSVSTTNLPDSLNLDQLNSTAAMPIEERERASAYYDGEVEQVDRWVGTLLEALENTASDRPRWIFVIADHGEELWDHEGVGHGHTLYEELLHVPLWVVPPTGSTLLPGRNLQTAVSLADLAPTIAELTGLSWPNVPGARSLVPDLRGEPLPQAALNRTLMASGSLYGPRRRALLHDGLKLTQSLAAPKKVRVSRLSENETEVAESSEMTRAAFETRWNQLLGTLPWTAASADALPEEPAIVGLATDEDDEAAQLEALGYHESMNGP